MTEVECLISAPHQTGFLAFFCKRNTFPQFFVSFTSHIWHVWSFMNYIWFPQPIHFFGGQRVETESHYVAQGGSRFSLLNLTTALYQTLLDLVARMIYLNTNLAGKMAEGRGCSFRLSEAFVLTTQPCHCKTEVAIDDANRHGCTILFYMWGLSNGSCSSDSPCQSIPSTLLGLARPAFSGYSLHQLRRLLLIPSGPLLAIPPREGARPYTGPT